MRWLRGEAALEALDREWPAAAAGRESTPFQGAAWLRHWFRHRAEEAVPIVVRCGEPDAAVAFALRRVLGVRVLALAGAPDSDYTGPTLDSPAVWQAIGAELSSRRDEFDAVHLHSIRDPEAARSALRAQLGAVGAERRYDACPYIDTSRGWDELLERRGKPLQREIRRWRRRVEERGELAFRVWQPPIPRSVTEELGAIERDSWKWRHGHAVSRDPAQRRFLEAVLEDPASPIRLWQLQVGGAPAAFALLLADPRTWYYYWPSHREEVANAGALLLAEIVRSACEQGCARVDLLRGAHAYKLLWADGSDDVHELVWSGGTAGRLVVWGHRARWRAARSPALQRLRARLQGIGDRRESG